ncbi:hypothetical protein OHC33_005553 [Knufia fluminis]|uniref:Uncharacterized protein n=1 Tax=Knufia fluminis TaxID=191047 RepID=A0AAN8EEA2_9EURO|nr:hypothetical protein OHC33_005553 [Knufia fluminis]
MPQNLMQTTPTRTPPKLQVDSLFLLIQRTHREHFPFMNESASKAVKAGVETMRTNTTRDEHNQKMRKIFDEILTKAVADNSMPDLVLDPPQQSMQFPICHWQIRRLSCLCLVPSHELPFVDVKAESPDVGVTKELVLKRLSEELYGSDAKKYSIGGEDDRPVIEGMMWVNYRDGTLHEPDGIHAMCLGFKEALCDVTGSEPYNGSYSDSDWEEEEEEELELIEDEGKGEVEQDATGQSAEARDGSGAEQSIQHLTDIVEKSRL